MVTRTRRLTEVVVLVAAVVGLVVFGLLAFAFKSALPQVDPRRIGHSTSSGGLNGTWVWCVVVSSLTMIAAAGLPGGKPWSSRGSARGAVVQAVGGVAVAGWTVAISRLNFYFTGSNDECEYSSCWPLDEQTAVLVIPGVSAGLVMITMALLVNRLPWSIRALTPAVVWIAALLIHYAVWTSYLLPIFEGPPR